MTRNIFIFNLLFTSIFIHAQPLQTIRGSVFDQFSQQKLEFSSIAILDTDPLIGAITDSDGKFLLEKVPVGRYDIQVSLIGYETKIIKEIIVTSSKQVVLEVGLAEQNYQLSEVVISTGVKKDRPINTMSTLSSRMLTVEEAKRFAGGFDDPARLASSFAGVASNSGVNGIIVRGNSPRYLQWKMEGVEIPNPNHFNDLRAFGGGILTGLSSQMLANSDFHTGAFPAEFNNALSGVFDLSMRKGNNEKTERTFQIGLIGIENSQEGPFKKGGKSSYLYNYRYSTLALVAPLILEESQGLKYQDLSFKMNFPSNKAGTFTFWGLGLRDAAKSSPKKDTLDWIHADDRQEDVITQNTGSLGLGHLIILSKNTYLKTNIASTINHTKWTSKALNEKTQLVPFSNINYINWNSVLTTQLNHKFSAKHSNRSGLSVTQLNYDLELDKAPKIGLAPTNLADADGKSILFSAFTQSSYNISSFLVMNLGFNGQYFTLNDHYTIEPRLGFKYQVNENHQLAIACGEHSRLENINFYLNNSLVTGEKAVNKELDFTRALHLVFAYDWNINKNLHLRIEPYFQDLRDVPVIENTSFSMINMLTDWFFAEKLVNKGKGRNYGVDLTLQKHITNGFYFLITGSIFESEYTGGDGVWRNARFNRNHVANFLIGKEWKLGSNKQHVLSVNARITSQGGNRYSPVNLKASLENKQVVYDETNSFSLQADGVLTSNLTISYRKNKAKSSREWSLKIINITGQEDFYGYEYNFRDKTIDKDIEKVILPNLSYKIEF